MRKEKAMKRELVSFAISLFLATIVFGVGYTTAKTRTNRILEQQRQWQRRHKERGTLVPENVLEVSSVTVSG